MPMIIAALLIPILVIFVGGGLLILVAYFLWRWIASKATLSSNFTTRPPATLAAPATITYHCDVILGRRPTKPLPGAEVTFTVSGVNSTVDGGNTKKVITDANGDASVILAPAKTGSDQLSVHVQAGNQGGDENPIPFEVVKH